MQQEPKFMQDQNQEPPTSIMKSAPVGAFAAVATIFIVAALWALIGFHIAGKLALGTIMLPIATGLAGGGMMKVFGRGLQPATQWVAVAVTVIGCIIGDVVWISWFTGKPYGQLFSEEEFTRTLNTFLNLQKVVFYLVASWIAFSLSRPRRFARLSDEYPPNDPQQ